MKKKILAIAIATLILSNPLVAKASAFKPCYLSDEIIGYCFDAQENQEISAALIAAVIQTESSGNPKAKNGNCIGLMQIASLHVQNPDDLYDSEFNIRIGTSILAECMEKADGELDLALAMYNGQKNSVSNFEAWANNWTGLNSAGDYIYSNAYATKVINLAEKIEVEWYD